jgi:hypothetical protein
MPLTFPLLTDDEVVRARELLEAAPWVDGRAVGRRPGRAGQAQRTGPGDSEAAREVQALVLRALERSPRFLAAALPKRVFPPRFNRYAGEANHYGSHVDSAIRFAEGGQRVRTDLSCTVFLSSPDSYDGGELVIHRAAESRPSSCRRPCRALPGNQRSRSAARHAREPGWPASSGSKAWCAATSSAACCSNSTTRSPACGNRKARAPRPSR